MNEDSKYLVPYRHPSMKYHDQLKAQKERRVRECDSMLLELERGEEALSHIQDFRTDALRALDWLAEMKANGYFADESLCGDKDYWIDWKSYYEDQADNCFAEVEATKELKAFAQSRPDATPEMFEALDKQIEKFTRFAHANLKKAGVPTLQRKIRQKMMEKRND